MSRVYTVQFNNIAVTAVQDLIGVYSGANMAFELHEIFIGQISATAIGNLRLSIKRMLATVTSGSGGSAPTPQKAINGDAAATVTARANDTIQATATSTSVLRSDVFNVINGYLWLPAPDDRPIIAPSQALIVSLDTAPGASETMSGTATFRELF